MFLPCWIIVILENPILLLNIVALLSFLSSGGAQEFFTEGAIEGEAAFEAWFINYEGCKEFLTWFD